MGGHPTLVSNVETLANLAAAVGAAGRWYAPITISGDAIESRLVEAAAKTHLREVLGDASEGCRRSLVRRPRSAAFSQRRESSMWHSTRQRCAMSGTTAGCGAFHLLSSDGCPVDSVADHAVSYLARESAQQCGSCINGTSGMAQKLQALSRAEIDADGLEPMRRWSTSLRGARQLRAADAACGLVASLFEHWQPGDRRASRRSWLWSVRRARRQLRGDSPRRLDRLSGVKERKVKLVVDSALCQGYGNCADEAPTCSTWTTSGTPPSEETAMCPRVRAQLPTRPSTLARSRHCAST